MLLVLLIFLLFVFLGMPTAFAIGIAGTLFFLQYRDTLPLTIVPQLLLTGTQNFLFLAVPFFIIVGNIMNRSGITRRIFRLFSLLLGHTKGGIAYVSAIATTLLGGISSSPFSISVMGSRIMGPEMLKNDFPVGFTTSVITSSSVSASVIPPAVSLILIGTIAGISMYDLFLRGILNSIFLLLLILLAIWFSVKKIGKESSIEKASFSEIKDAFIKSIWAFILPIGVIFLLRSAWITPAQVGVYAILYALIVGAFIHKELTLRRFFESLRDSMLDIGTIFSLIIFTGILGYGIVYEKIPESLISFIYSFTKNPWFIILLLSLILLIFSTFLDTTILILILGRVFLSLTSELGFNPTHMALMFIVICAFGNILPPAGPSLYVTFSVLKASLENYLKDFKYFFLFLLLGLIFLFVIFH